MTEIHAVTADQSVFDHAHDLRRARASATLSRLLSALGALKRVMPKMEDRIDGYSIWYLPLNVAQLI